MNTIEALRLYQFDSTKDLTQDIIKSQYRVMAKRCHPDNGFNVSYTLDDVKQAKEILLLTLKNKLSSYESVYEPLIIRIEDLVTIYTQGWVDVNNKRYNIKSLENPYTCIEFTGRYSLNGVEHELREYTAYKDNYEYRIDIDETVKKGVQNNIKIEIADKKYDVDIKSQGIQLKVRYAGFINVMIQFTFSKEE